MEWKMTVIRDIKSSELEFECINLLDVDYQEVDKSRRRIIYYIGDKKYYSITCLEESEELLRHHDYFLTDRKNLVNLRKIKFIDYDYRNLYFENPPTKHSRFAAIAAINLRVLKNVFERIVAFNNGVTQEFKLSGSIGKAIMMLFQRR